jgi:23S rRNA (pseudouridine1915-N3)-methyltransferase
MLKIKIITVGKTKEPWLQRATEEYLKRLQGSIAIEWVLCKSTDQLITSLDKESSWTCLDPRGPMLTSEEFSSFLFKTLEAEGSRLNIVIGGAEGLPQKIKTQARHLISFSKMTFTHQMTRLILLEQIYRAHEIKRGSGYHK